MQRQWPTLPQEPASQRPPILRAGMMESSHVFLDKNNLLSVGCNSAGVKIGKTVCRV